ncbi:helix-turn-helix domain-containing protein [Arthrobacter sp. HLT1-20]
MVLEIRSRSSDSPWVSSVWTCRSAATTEMTAVATETWGLVFWEQQGRAYAAATGPETQTTTAPVPEDAVFRGIQFAVGTSLRMTPTSMLVNSGIDLPETTRRRFWLDGHRWETPGSDDAEALVDRLVRYGVVVRDPTVTAVLSGRPVSTTDRTIERRFRAATGLSRGAVGQIERARTAAEQLASGATVADVVSVLGFFDEPHLARALRRYVGRTAGQLRGGMSGLLALSISVHDVVDDLHDPVGVGIVLPQN